MKAKIELGAEIDTLTRDELAAELKRSGDWQRQAAEGMRTIDLPVLSGAIVGGAVTLDGGTTEGGNYCGPRSGFYWKIERISISGLGTALATAGGYASGVQIAPVAGTAIATLAAANLPKGAYIVRVNAGFGANPETTTDFNMDLLGNGGAVIKGRLLVTAAANNVRQFVFDEVVMDGASSLQVVAHATASAGSAYVADISASPIAASQASTDAISIWKGGPSNGRFVATISGPPYVWQPSGPALILKPGDVLSLTGTGLGATGTVRMTGEAVSVPGPMMWKLL